jgi:hypothetical protein
MDYSDIFSIIGDLNENKQQVVGDYEPVHYKLNYDNETNIEQFLDKFTATTFNETGEEEDENFINLVTEEDPEIIGDNEDPIVQDDENPIIQDEDEDEDEEVINIVETTENDEEIVNIVETTENDDEIVNIVDGGVEPIPDDNIVHTLGDWKEVNLEEVARENREIKDIAYEEKAKLKQEIIEEKETFAEDPKSVYKDINDLITRYRDVI